MVFREKRSASRITISKATFAAVISTSWNSLTLLSASEANGACQFLPARAEEDVRARALTSDAPGLAELVLRLGTELLVDEHCDGAGRSDESATVRVQCVTRTRRRRCVSNSTQPMTRAHGARTSVGKNEPGLEWQYAAEQQRQHQSAQRRMSLARTHDARKYARTHARTHAP